MSKRVGNIFIIQEEPEGVCELCGKTAELRPYGEHGERICFECAMKNKETTDRKFREIIDGVEGVRNENIHCG